MKKITPITIKRAKPRPDPYEISGQHRLILRIQPTGKKTFYVQLGRGHRERLGDATVMTVKRAEHKAREKLNELDDFGNVVNADPKKATLAASSRPSTRRGSPRTGAVGKDPQGFETKLRRLVRPSPYRPRSQQPGRLRGRQDQGRLRRGNDRARSEQPARGVQGRHQGQTQVRALEPVHGWEAPKPDDCGVTRYLTPEEEAALRLALVERDDKARRERVSHNDWLIERGHELLPEFSEKGYTDHLAPMVLVSVNSGLRYGELAALEWPAVDLRARVLTVTEEPRRGNARARYRSTPRRSTCSRAGKRRARERVSYSRTRTAHTLVPSKPRGLRCSRPRASRVSAGTICAIRSLPSSCSAG